MAPLNDPVRSIAGKSDSSDIRKGIIPVHSLRTVYVTGAVGLCCLFHVPDWELDNGNVYHGATKRTHTWGEWNPCTISHVDADTDPVAEAQRLIRDMDMDQLQRVRETIHARMFQLEPLPSYWGRYPTASTWSALQRWRQDCLENAWSKESAEAVELANSLGPQFLEALPPTVAEMDLPTVGQLRYVWRNEPHETHWHMLIWQGWSTGEDYRAVCGVTLRKFHGQSQRPAAVCSRCEARLTKLRETGLSV